MSRLKRPLRIYRSPKGIWHIDFQLADGSVRWSTLGTRDEAKARSEFERLKEWFARMEKEGKA